MLNFAVRYYGLPNNPCRFVKKIGKVHRSLNFWTLEDFQNFLPTVQDPVMRTAFLVLFYTGIRCGELQALTVGDFNVEERSITIRKTYHRFNKVDLVTEPKTENSKRTILIPAFLSEEIQEDVYKRQKLPPLSSVFHFYVRIQKPPFLPFCHFPAFYIWSQPVEDTLQLFWTLIGYFKLYCQYNHLLLFLLALSSLIP